MPHGMRAAEPGEMTSLFDGIDPLAALRDIREPAPPWWSSPEWLAAIACVLAAVCLWHWWRKRRHADPRRAALRELAALRRRHAAGEGDGATIAELAALLRRFALVKYRRTRVAGLCGTTWTDFLHNQAPPATFTATDARVFAWAPYAANPRVDAAALLTLTESLIGWLHERGDNNAPLTEPCARRTDYPRLFAARRRLRSACLTNDARAARQALLDWAAHAWRVSPPRRISALGARLGDDGFSRALAALDHALYAPGAQAWRGRDLWRRARGSLKPPPRKVAAVGALPPLYG